MKYTRNPLASMIAYSFRKKSKVEFKWGFSASMDWPSISCVLQAADAGWHLCDYNQGQLMFTDGKFKFIASDLSKVGELARRRTPFKCFDYSNAVVLDVGAFTGDTVILFFRWGAKKVIAYEPVLENVEIMKRNVEINSLQERVTIMPYAVCDRRGYMKFSYNDFGEGFGLEQGRFTVELPCMSMLEVLKKAADVDIAKINCEGCEKYILKTNRLTIPKWVIQVHDSQLLPLLANHLRDKGYNIYITPQGRFCILRAIRKHPQL